MSRICRNRSFLRRIPHFCIENHGHVSWHYWFLGETITEVGYLETKYCWWHQGFTITTFVWIQFHSSSSPSLATKRIWANQPIHSFLVKCLNPCLQETNAGVGSPQPTKGSTNHHPISNISKYPRICNGSFYFPHVLSRSCCMCVNARGRTSCGQSDGGKWVAGIV